MALGFFRKHQKMVIIIMVVLMISFLVGFQGFSSLIAPKPEKQEVATTREGSLLWSDVTTAQNDLEILTAMRMDYRFIELAILTQSVQDPARQYALLLKEARSKDIAANDDDVREYVAQVMDRPSYEQFVKQERRNQVSKERIELAVANWICVHRSLVDGLVNAPPSEREMMLLARNQLERIDLSVLVIPADKFLPQVPQPTEDQINQQFARYQRLLPNDRPTDLGMGFGYMIPPRVAIAWLLIRTDRIERLAAPTIEEVEKYYAANREQMGGKTLAQADDEIAAQLRPEIAGALTQAVLAASQQLIREYPTRPGATAEATPYQYALNHLRVTGPRVQSVLDQKVTVYLNGLSVPAALTELASKAKLRAIGLPTRDADGNELVDPNFRLSGISGETTVGAALEAIQAQAKLPAVTWCFCRGIDNVLVPTDPALGFPVQERQSDLMSARQMRDDKVLGSAYRQAPRGQQIIPLATDAFQSKPFAQNPTEQQHLLDIGDEAGPERVIGTEPGWLFWRLTQATQPRPAQDLAEVREQVIQDWRMNEAFEKAVLAARAIRNAPAFDAAVRKGTYEHVETGMLSRNDIARSWQPDGFKLPGYAQMREAFQNEVFSTDTLLPASPEPPVPQKSERVSVFRVAPERQVLVLRRVGYAPMDATTYMAYRGSFTMPNTILADLASQRRIISVQLWYQMCEVRMGARWER